MVYTISDNACLRGRPACNATGTIGVIIRNRSFEQAVFNYAVVHTHNATNNTIATHGTHRARNSEVFHGSCRGKSIEQAFIGGQTRYRIARTIKGTSVFVLVTGGVVYTLYRRPCFVCEVDWCGKFGVYRAIFRHFACKPRQFCCIRNLIHVIS